MLGKRLIPESHVETPLGVYEKKNNHFTQVEEECMDNLTTPILSLE